MRSCAAASGFAAAAVTIEDMIVTRQQAVDELRAMRKEGAALQEGGGRSDAHAQALTTDPDVAAKYEFAPEEDEHTEASDNYSDVDVSGAEAPRSGPMWYGVLKIARSNNA
jgi:hypothetical protein